jgi:hypothetical protein
MYTLPAFNVDIERVLIVAVFTVATLIVAALTLIPNEVKLPINPFAVK